jgi:hypothetical protein
MHKNSGTAVAVDDLGGRHVSSLRVQLAMTLALAFAIAIAATAVSIGAARADTVQAITRPDTGLVLTLLIGAIGVIVALTAVAGRLTGRPRQR